MDVFYICDRRACDHCSQECQHTPDMRHAANFEIRGAAMWEREPIGELIETSEIRMSCALNKDQIRAIAEDLAHEIRCADATKG